MATVLGVFKMAQTLSFYKKPLTKDTAQMSLFLVFNESATAKIALRTYLKRTYLKPTINENYVGWA